jgi:hypothetical protein
MRLVRSFSAACQKSEAVADSTQMRTDARGCGESCTIRDVIKPSCERERLARSNSSRNDRLAMASGGVDYDDDAGGACGVGSAGVSRAKLFRLARMTATAAKGRHMDPFPGSGLVFGPSAVPDGTRVRWECLVVRQFELTHYRMFPSVETLGLDMLSPSATGGLAS